VKDKISVFLATFALGFNVAVLLMTGTRSALMGLLVLGLLLPALVLRYRHQCISTGWRIGHCVGVTVLFLTSAVCLGSIDTANPKLMAESGRGDAIDRALTRTWSITQAGEYSHGSFSVRTLMWKTNGRMILANPVAGVGAGAWEVQAPRYQEAGTELETDFYAHNEPLQLVAEYGLTGWLFLSSLLSYLLWAACRTWSDNTFEAKREGPLRAFTLASLLVFLLVSNAGFPWRLATTGALFALSLSILAASDIRLAAGSSFLSRGMKWRPRYAEWALLATALCMALGACIAQQAITCEARLVQAIKIALTISQSGYAHDPRWENAKTEMLGLVREGIAINPHYRKLTPIVADALASWGDWKNATWLWESVLASRPNVVIILANAARGHLQSGNRAKAQEYFDRAMALQPAAPTLLPLQEMLGQQAKKEWESTPGKPPLPVLPSAI
jgi:Tfp pilus assembly protein PilF